MPRSLCLSAVFVAAIAAALLGGCAAGPEYVRPVPEMPVAYKESGPWKAAQPQPIDTNPAWWQRFGDPVLGGLIDEAGRANQTLRQAEAQYRQAHALALQARAGYFPTVGASAGASRARSTTPTPRTATDLSVNLTASWEPDLWGGVRRSVEAGQASEQASADDLAAARLSLQAELAQDYWQLRVDDVLRDQYAATTEAYARSLQLTQSQFAAGVVLRSDVALAESQLKTAQAQAVDLEASRAQLEHAIAILTGHPPAAFALAPVKQSLEQLQARLPEVPTGLPSELLERRPDIAAAERRAAAANAQIGVARAALYPSLVLSAGGGYASGTIAALLDAPSRVWTLGASLAQTLFDGGLRQARSDEAIAAYDASVAAYKETVLGGFQQVEDNLSALNVLDREYRLQQEAVQAAQQAERSALSQYRAGSATYLAVVTAQTLALTNERTATQLLGRQLAASVALITATGGGWQAEAATAPASAPARSASSSTATPLALAAPAQPATP